MSADIRHRLNELEQQIVRSYESYSIVDRVCTVGAIPANVRPRSFTQFANRFLIERAHITDHTRIFFVGELGTSVARSEINHMIHEFSDNIEPRRINEFSMMNIRNAVRDLIQNGFEPNFIFIPNEYFHNVFEWNSQSPIRGPDISPLNNLIVDTRILKVQYSNRYIPFNNIIITCKDENLWEYRPSDNRPEKRLTAQFLWDEGNEEQTILLVKTIFNFQLSNEATIVLKPEQDQTYRSI